MLKKKSFWSSNTYLVHAHTVTTTSNTSYESLPRINLFFTYRTHLFTLTRYDTFPHKGEKSGLSIYLILTLLSFNRSSRRARLRRFMSKWILSASSRVSVATSSS